MKNDQTQVQESRSRNRLIAIFACLAAGLILAGIFYYRHIEAQYRAEVGRGLSSIAGLKTEELEHFRKDHIKDASLFFKNPAFAGLVRRYFADPQDKAAKKQLQDWLEHAMFAGSYDRIRLMDAGGATRLSFPASLPAPTAAVSRYAAETMRAGRPDFKDFYRNEQDNRVYVSIGTPIHDAAGGGRPLGILVLRIDPSKHIYPFLAQWPIPSRTAETLLVRRDGEDALILSPDRFRKDAALTMRIPLSRTEVPAVRAALGRTGVAEGIDYSGEAVLADTRQIPDSPWSLVTRIDISEFEAPLKKQSYLVILFTSVLLLAAGAGLAFVWKKQSDGYHRNRLAAAEELRDSEEKARFALDIANMGLWTLNLLDKTAQRSLKHDQIFGYERLLPEWTFDMFLEHVVPEDRAEVARKFQQAVETRSDWKFECRIKRRDGEQRWILASGRHRLDAAGQAVMMEGIVQDITERREAEEELRKSETRIKAITDSALDAIIMMDRGGRVSYWNPAAVSMFGYTKEEALGRDVHELLTPQRYRAVQLAGVAEFQRTGKGPILNITRELMALRKSGEEFYVSLSVSGVRLGSEFYAVGIVRDITARVAAEQELRKLSLAVTESPVTVIITDAKGDIEYVNRRFTEASGYSFDEVRGVTPRILKAGTQPPEIYAELWKTISSGKTWRGELHNRKKNGELYWDNISISPLLDSSGIITHYISVQDDITERKRLEGDLRAAKLEAELANRAKSVFLSKMSHEIRTPLNAILGFSQLLRRDPQATQPQRQRLDIINRSGENLLELINEILELSRIESGRLTLNKAPFDLHTMLEDLIKMFKARADAKGLRLELERLVSVPRFLYGDQAKLRQVLVNLMGNAVKFTSSGGVSLRLRAGGYGEGRFRLEAEVEDSGPGMTNEEMAFLFKPFEQTKAGRVEGTGTGLGLAISREYAQLMGGAVTASSRPGEGSVFKVSVVMEEAGQADMPAAQGTRHVKGLKPGQPRYRVLIADDKEDNRVFLTELLGPAGFETRAVADGAQVLKEFEAWLPQLILMDLRMPVMDGHEAMKRLRAHEKGKTVKIIAVSASAFTEAQREAGDSGADDFIAKPFREAELFEKMGRLLGAEYVYEGEAAAAQPGTGTPEPGSLAGLPRELLTGLREAASKGDFELLADLVRQAETNNAGLASKLLGLTEEFDSTGILALLAKVDSHD